MTATGIARIGLFGFGPLLNRVEPLVEEENRSRLFPQGHFQTRLGELLPRTSCLVTRVDIGEAILSLRLEPSQTESG
jgi:hypothetical protein